MEWMDDILVETLGTVVGKAIYQDQVGIGSAAADLPPPFDQRVF